MTKMEHLTFQDIILIFYCQICNMDIKLNLSFAKNLETEEDLNNFIDQCKIIGDETNIKIIHILCDAGNNETASKFLMFHILLASQQEYNVRIFEEILEVISCRKLDVTKFKQDDIKHLMLYLYSKIQSKEDYELCSSFKTVFKMYEL